MQNTSVCHRSSVRKLTPRERSVSVRRAGELLRGRGRSVPSSCILIPRLWKSAALRISGRTHFRLSAVVANTNETLSISSPTGSHQHTEKLLVLGMYVAFSWPLGSLICDFPPESLRFQAHRLVTQTGQPCPRPPAPVPVGVPPLARARGPLPHLSQKTLNPQPWSACGGQPARPSHTLTLPITPQVPCLGPHTASVRGLPRRQTEVKLRHGLGADAMS